VFCLPGEIPEKIEVDVSGLDIGDSIHVAELNVPAGIEVEAEADRSVVTVLAPVVAAVEEEAVAEEVPAEPELIGKRKAEEEEAEERP